MSVVIYFGILMVVVCLVVWLQDMKIETLGELVDVHEDVLDELWCDAVKKNKEINIVRECSKHNFDTKDKELYSIRQDICGLKTGHDMEIVEAQPTHAFGYNTGYVTIRRQCKTCKAVVEAVKPMHELSPEDCNVLKYKFNIDMPATKQDKGNAASKKRKSK